MTYTPLPRRRNWYRNHMKLSYNGLTMLSLDESRIMQRIKEEEIREAWEKMMDYSRINEARFGWIDGKSDGKLIGVMNMQLVKRDD